MTRYQEALRQIATLENYNVLRDARDIARKALLREDDMQTVTFEQLRKLRDSADAIGSTAIAAALTELIHLRAARITRVDGVELRTGADQRIEPKDLRP